MKKIDSSFLIAVIFMAIGVASRLIPHLPNFSPVAAVAIFSGVYLSKKTALILPLLIMIVSDFFIGFYDWRLMAFVYISFLLSVVLGLWLKSRRKWYFIAGVSICASLIFFVLTNFAVWAFADWYAKSFAGLLQCYVAALPFLKNTLAGDLFYVFVFIGAYELAVILFKRLSAGKIASINL